ncbi:sugar transferase [Paenibacillus silviterrae]|uniref:sugar transferase n=1 Tax=Paenibacillus silviterrae TaxID=3242194 RepID=UPI002542CA89|nr:sugar transferase [Paenibacillus chinjuensis]
MDEWSRDVKVLKTAAYHPGAEAQVIFMGRPEQQKAYLWIKRILDIVGAFIGLLLLCPLMLIVAILLKLESPMGSIFFSQTRVGKDGAEFTMFKFRSMVPDAERHLKDLLEKNEIQGAMFKIKDDPRITKVGRWIRRTSIDELPQLWNVLRGDMSLVGPRPALPREVAQYTGYHRQRLAVTPGCTGLWQVSGRNGLTFDEMVFLDLYYIRNRSIWFDTKLVLRTVWIIFFPNNAY